MKLKKIIAMTLTSAMILSLGACGSSASADAGANAADGSKKTAAKAGLYPGTPEEGMVTVDLRGEPPELNSLLCTDVASSDILREVVSGLYKLDENDIPQPDLAEDTQVSEDGCTYTMKIRQDAKWSNGEPVTAHDFVFALQKICDPEVASAYAFIVYDNIVNGSEVYAGTKKPSELGVKALDDYTLEVQFVNPIPYAKHLFAFTSYYPVNQKAYEEIGADKYAKDADKIVTNGPYKIADWQHDDHVTLEKNQEYYNADDIKIDTVKYIIIKDANARMNAFKAGAVDSIDLEGEQVGQAEAEGITTDTFVDNGNWYLQYNTKVAGLDNSKIRRALGMAIDTQSLVDNVLKTGSIVATGLVPTAIKGADGKNYRDAAGDILTFDKEEAKKLFEEGLKEAGIDKKDFKPTFTTNDTSYCQKEAAYYQEEWRKTLGIEVDIKPMPFKSRLDAMEAGNFDIVMSGWAPDYNDPMTYMDMFTTTNGNNNGKYSNPKYDVMIAEAMKEVDAQKRQEILIEAEKLLVQEDAAVFPLYFSVKPYAVSDKLKGMTRTGFQEFDFTDGAEIVK